MFLSLVCVCLGLVPVLSETAKPCCSPPLYEGYEISNSARYDSNTKEYRFREYTGNVYFSTPLQRRVVIRNADDPATMIRIINDFRGGKDYVITNGTCTIRDQFWPSDDCIDGNAELIKSTNVGNGIDSIDVDVWLTKFGSVTHTTTVSREKCYHLEKTWYGTFTGITVEGTRVYLNLKEGVNDTSVFDIPDICTEDPPKCCLPTNYTATIVNFGSIIDTSNHQTFLHSVGTTYVDGTNNLQVVVQQDDRTGAAVTQYLDYDANIVRVVRDGQCTVESTNFTLVKCIPDDATLVAATFMGSPFNPLKVNIWDFNWDGSKVRLGVTAGGCYPYFDNYQFTLLNRNFRSGFQYGAIKPSLSPADVAKFTVPASCNQVG